MICIHVITKPFCIKTEYQLREHIVLIKNWEKGNWDRTICWSNLSLLIYWLSKCPSTLTREQQSLNFKGRKSTSWSMNSRIGVIQFRTTSQSGMARENWNSQIFFSLEGLLLLLPSEHTWIFYTARLCYVKHCFHKKAAWLLPVRM